MHDIDQLVQLLKQDGYAKFQLLSPEEAAHLNGLIHGTVWHTHGFCLCCDLHTKLYTGLELCTRPQNDIQHRIAELIPKGGAAIAQLVCHPDLMALLSQYLGHSFRCATFSSNTLLPQGIL